MNEKEVAYLVPPARLRLIPLVGAFGLALLAGLALRLSYRAYAVRAQRSVAR